MAVELIIGFGQARERDVVLQLIGCAAQTGAQLEFRLSLLTAALLALPQKTGIFMLGRESAARLFGTLRKIIAAIGDATAQAEIESWVKRSQATYERRNAVIHSIINHDVQTGRLYWTRLTNQLQGFGFKYEPIEMNDLQTVADAVEKLCDEFDKNLTATLIHRLPYTRASLGHPPI
jgi:hypothetical protein